MRAPTIAIVLATTLTAGALVGCGGEEEDEYNAPPIATGPGGSSGATASGATASASASDSAGEDDGSSDGGEGPNEPGIAPTCENGEFKVVGTVDGQAVNTAPEITGRNYNGFAESLRLDLAEDGELRLGWETTVEGPVDVTGYLDLDGFEGRICAGSGSFLNLDPMESLPFELRGLMVSQGDCEDATPVSGELLGCWGAGW